VVDAGLVEDLADRGEADVDVQLPRMELGVQHHRFIPVPLDHRCQQAGRQPPAPVLRVRHHAADDQVRGRKTVDDLGVLVAQDAQVGGEIPAVPGTEQVVLGGRFEVASVEFLVITLLLAEEDLGAQPAIA